MIDVYNVNITTWFIISCVNIPGIYIYKIHYNFCCCCLTNVYVTWNQYKYSTVPVWHLLPVLLINFCSLRIVFCKQYWSVEFFIYYSIHKLICLSFNDLLSRGKTKEIHSHSKKNQNQKSNELHSFLSFIGLEKGHPIQGHCWKCGRSTVHSPTDQDETQATQSVRSLLLRERGLSVPSRCPSQSVQVCRWTLSSLSGLCDI